MVTGRFGNWTFCIFKSVGCVDVAVDGDDEEAIRGGGLPAPPVTICWVAVGCVCWRITTDDVGDVFRRILADVGVCGVDGVVWYDVCC